MSSAPANSLPQGVGRINPHDHGAALLLTGGLSLGITVIAITLRLFQRWPWRALLKLEDYLLLAAAAFEIGDVAAVAQSVHVGMGRHIDTLSASQIDLTKQALIASFAITFIVEAAANLSSVTFLSVMYPNAKNRYFFRGLAAVIIMWGVAGVIRMSVSLVPGVAPLDRATWIGFGVVSIIIQLTLFSFSMYTIWSLQTSVSKKLGCSIYFGLCIPAAAVTATRLAYTPEDTFSGDFVWRDLPMVVISLIESNVVIISAAYPSMRSFLTKVSTGFLLAGITNETKAGTKGTGSNSFAMNQMSQASQQSRRSKLATPGFQPWSNSANASSAVPPGGDAKSVKSFGSQVIMIRTDINVDEADSA